MTQLVLAVAFLLATHFDIASTRLRGVLVARLGEGWYRAVYSLIALVAFVLLARAYDRAPYLELWSAGWTPYATAVLMVLASILAVAGLTTPNPTAVGQEKALEGAEPVRGVLRVTRHPFLWAVGLWAIGHGLANGDLASLLLFGGLGALALVGTLLIDAKLRARLGDRWRSFAGSTSNLPLLAVARGRQRLAPGEIGWLRLIGGVTLYVLLVFAHPWLFGVPALP